VDSPSPNRSSGALKAWLGIFLFLLLAGLALCWKRQSDISRDVERWDHFVAEWTAKGEDFSAGHWAPPAVPDADNFAAHPAIAALWASGTSEPSKALAQIDPKEVPGMNDAQVSDPELTWLEEHPKDAAEALARLQPVAPLLASVREAAGRSGCRFAFDAERLEELQPDGRFERLNLLSLCLAAEAEASLMAGSEVDSAADLEAMFRIGSHLRSQREMLLMLQGAAFENRAIEVINAGVRQKRWSPGTRTRLLAALPSPAKLSPELCDMIRLDRGNFVRVFDTSDPNSDTVKASSKKPVWRAWFHPPQRDAAVEKWVLCSKYQPFLSSGGDPANDFTLRFSPTELNQPGPGQFARKMANHVGVVVGQLLQLEDTRLKPLREELAK